NTRLPTALEILTAHPSRSRHVQHRAVDFSSLQRQCRPIATRPSASQPTPIRRADLLCKPGAIPLPEHTASGPPLGLSTMDLHLPGKRVLITGASKGIGATAAEAFAEEGCHLRLAARNGEALEALAQRLRAAHGIEVTAHAVDLRQADQLAKLAESASDVDILINNAGDIPGGTLDGVDEKTWRHAWEL